MTTQPPNKSQPREFWNNWMAMSESEQEAKDFYPKPEWQDLRCYVERSALEALQAENLALKEKWAEVVESAFQLKLRNLQLQAEFSEQENATRAIIDENFKHSLEWESAIESLQTKLEKAKAALEEILTCESVLGAPAHIEGIRKIARQALADCAALDKGEG